MSNPQEEARRRSEHARQVISGGDLRAPTYNANSVAFEGEGPFSSPQWIYLAILFAILAISVIIYLLFGGGVASVFFFLLALMLFAGWFVF